MSDQAKKPAAEVTLTQPGNPTDGVVGDVINPSNQEDEMLAEIGAFTELLHQQGPHVALEYLNRRTPHRYTGLFRFDNDILRNELLVDRNHTGVRQGEDVPMAATYCSLVGRQQAHVNILDAATDPLAQEIETPVISYCGVLIRDDHGQAYGTLCHYDMQRCQERTTDLPLLAAAARLLYQHLHTGTTTTQAG